MEYIKKEELIEGEIYYVSTTYGFWMIGLVTKSNNGDNDYSSFRGNATYISKDEDFNKDQSWCYEANGRTYRLASSEEKHWLEICIKENKFISYEEAMKTFIPEYLELLPGWSSDGEFVGEIFDTKKDFQEQFKKFKFVSKHADWKEVLRLNWIPKFFKPSTKEAYDAQFVVIEPLPQFKVIETIETITKVENNEGNQFFIGDVVISDSGFVQTIKSFRYNVNKDNVLATTNVCNQISIARLEHYIEPKVENQFKIGDTIKISTIHVDGSQPEYLNNNYKIIKIRGKQLLFETNSIPPINSVLAKMRLK